MLPLVLKYAYIEFEFIRVACKRGNKLIKAKAQHANEQKYRSFFWNVFPLFFLQLYLEFFF